MDPLSAFHPAVQRWFATRLGEPTPPQREGWPLIREGRNTLIAAPTGSGKTLAAFLSAIDALLRQGAAPARRDAGPLRLAAARPVQRRPEEPPGPLAEIRAARPVAARGPRAGAHGRHAGRRARGHGASRPPHILVTTPESLYLLLTSDGGRRDAGARCAPSSWTRSTPSSATSAARTSRSRSSASRRWPAGRSSASASPPRRSRSTRSAASWSAPAASARWWTRAPSATLDLGDRGPALAARAPSARTSSGTEIYARIAELIARAPHHARLREHAQDGRAHRGPAHASSWARTRSPATTAASRASAGSTPSSG